VVAYLVLVRPMRRAIVLVFFGVTSFIFAQSPTPSPSKREAVLFAPKPAFPAEARHRHAAGSGLFALHVRPDGTVERVETLKSIGDASLDQAAIDAFRRWRFRHQDKNRVARIPITYGYGL